MFLKTLQRSVTLLKTLELKLARPSGATHHFKRGLDLFPAIDHILAGPEIRFTGPVKVWRMQYDGVWPSDHYPISIEVRIH